MQESGLKKSKLGARGLCLLLLLLVATGRFGASIARAQNAPEDAPIQDVAPGETPAPSANTSANTASNRAASQPSARPKAALPKVAPSSSAPKSNAATPSAAPSTAPKSSSPASPALKNSVPPVATPRAVTPDAKTPSAEGTTATPNAAASPEDAPIDDSAPGENAAPGDSATATSPGATASHGMEDTPVGASQSATQSGASDAEIAVPAWWNVPASFAPGFMRQALLSGLVVALLCGYLSVFVVLKRIAFVGVALSQVCSAGVALGFLWGFSPQLGAFAFMLAGVALFAWSPDPRRVPRESYIGAVYAVAGACGVLLIALNASGESTMLDLLQGDILAGDVGALQWLIGVFALLAIAHATFQKEWVLVSFDREAANTLGFPAVRWDFLLFLTVGIAIALSIRAVGALLTSALLILPGATALLLCSRLRGAFWMAPLLTIIPVILGLHASFISTANAPPSALIAALLFVFFLIALGWRTAQGRLRN